MPADPLQPRLPRLRASRKPLSADEEAALDRGRRIKAGIADLGPGPDQQAYWALQSEADLDRYIRRTATSLGFHPYHTAYSIRSEAGFPDWVLASPTRTIFAESKKEGDGPRPGHYGKRGRWIAGQEEWLARLWFASPSRSVYLWWPSDTHDIAEILQLGHRPAMPCVQRAQVVATIGAETFPPDAHVPR